VPNGVRLGRVTTGSLDLPRGPDVAHRVRVPSSWLDEGATIELELPRNLACASCNGGGCDACQRAGAVTLRAREDPAEVLAVTLPRRGDSAELAAAGRGVMLRIPERGGVSQREGSVRGLLMLTVITAERADPGVVRLDLPHMLESGKNPAPTAGSVRPSEASTGRVVGVLAVLVALWILGLILLRATGCA
jgi:hypothetical protein